MELLVEAEERLGLAFEPRERDVLKDLPRRPDEAIFDRVMITRVLVSATLMSVVAFSWFKILLDSGVEVAMARNQVLLLMVLFDLSPETEAETEAEARDVAEPAPFVPEPEPRRSVLGARGLVRLAWRPVEVTRIATRAVRAIPAMGPIGNPMASVTRNWRICRSGTPPLCRFLGPLGNGVGALLPISTSAPVGSPRKSTSRSARSPGPSTSCVSSPGGPARRADARRRPGTSWRRPRPPP